MKIELPDTSTRDISKTLVSIKETAGQVATGRVLTLIVVVSSDDDIDCLIHATSEASREHPSRVLMLVTGDENAETSRIDAKVLIGGDAGASEIVVMKLEGEVSEHLESVVTPLLLPDTPIVAWWPSAAPVDPSADPIGRIAQRRITDALYDPPEDSIYRRRNHYTPGDSDMAWARITPWRGIVASTMDQPPHEEVLDARVFGPAGSPSVDLAAGWLADRLGVNIVRESTGQDPIPLDAEGKGCIPLTKVELIRKNSIITIEVTDATTMTVNVPGKAPALVALTRRSQADCLAEELRHLDPDLAYGRALRGLNRVRYVDTFNL
ncbi:glucose-6-phosphate dehydrogenase assembly protein OpcA [Corynebacterium aquilae]|uniref:Oxppcycle protein OpcA n=1 Tax=Corynebacterium aquilae DSM 44791 TaxID=1431546 RepID=A0A1L7CG45_9CORY|nr:glucose-6-phosphate dehydrogenase assembly protein OpcA [Corynebacterium aquilae]APT84808.1 oxppcycle protein OpcA [Corynebacterium aquilae DSM 44791]